MEMMHGAPGSEWVRLLWVVALVGVLATHLWHAWTMPGQRVGGTSGTRPQRSP